MESIVTHEVASGTSRNLRIGFTACVACHIDVVESAGPEWVWNSDYGTAGSNGGDNVAATAATMSFQY